VFFMSKANLQRAGTGEKLQYLVRKFNDNTIRFLLHYPGLVDADILCAAVKAVIARIDILHASFFAGKVGAYWSVNETFDETSCFLAVKTPEEPAAAAASLFLLPVLPDSQTKMQCFLVQNRKTSAIVLLISHLCADGADAKYLLCKLAEAYCRIRDTGSAEGLTLKNGDRRAEQVYRGLPRKTVRSLMRNPLSAVKSAFPYPTEQPGTAQLVRITIPGETMNAAGARAKACGATVNDLLLTAGYHAYARLPGCSTEDPMSILSMMDLRRHCPGGDSPGLANLSGAMTTVLNCSAGTDFSRMLQEIAAQTRAAKENPLAGLEGMPLLHTVVRTVPLGILSRVAGRLYAGFSIGLTNLGNVSRESLRLGTLEPDSVAFGGPLKQKPGMQISAIRCGGACVLSVVGRYTDADAVLLRQMLDDMAAAIADYAAGN